MDDIKFSHCFFDDLKIEYMTKTLKKYNLNNSCSKDDIIQTIEKLKEKRNELEDQISEYEDEIDDLINALDCIYIVDKFNSLGCSSFLIKDLAEVRNEPS